MTIKDIVIRSLSGYIFVVPGILAYFWYLKKAGKKQSLLHIAAAFVFCYYIIGVLTMTSIGKLRAFSPRLVLIPFLDMISGPVDTILNVILFLPLGVFLPLLYKKYKGIGSVALTGFSFSLSIELIQMFGRGTTDINDLITNTVGASLGYLVYKLLFKRMKKSLNEKLQASKIHDGMEVLLFAAYSLVIMVTIQPLMISSLFRLG